VDIEKENENLDGDLKVKVLFLGFIREMAESLHFQYLAESIYF
jgi:hypothetical protein